MLLPFTYQLPLDRIAQRPTLPYDRAKLLVFESSTSKINDLDFRSLTKLLKPTDLLILNNTHVSKARLLGRLPNGGEAELLLIERLSLAPLVYLAMARPKKKLKVGSVIRFNDQLKAQILDSSSDSKVGEREVKALFLAPTDDISATDLISLIDEQALMPIPPYIRSGRSDQQDLKDYQSLFDRLAVGRKAQASSIGDSIAAPTASLHFTDSLVDELKQQGVEFEELTLQLGSASFLALDSQPNLRPGVEYYLYSTPLVKRINEHQGRVIAVGTSAVRALESMLSRAVSREECIDGQSYPTDLFIAPGYKFKRLDALITNFHQPATSHLLLVEAFIGRSALEKIYDHAVKSDYRFLSYGDAMLLT